MYHCQGRRELKTLGQQEILLYKIRPQHSTSLGVAGTPLRNLLVNYKELAEWVRRGMGRLHNERPDSDLERSEFIIMSSKIISVNTTYRGLGLFVGHDPPFVTVRFTNSEKEYWLHYPCLHTKDLHVGVLTQMEDWFDLPFGRRWFFLQDGLDSMVDIGSMAISNRQCVIPVIELLDLPLGHH